MRKFVHIVDYSRSKHWAFTKDVPPEFRPTDYLDPDGRFDGCDIELDDLVQSLRDDKWTDITKERLNWTKMDDLARYFRDFTIERYLIGFEGGRLDRIKVTSYNQYIAWRKDE